MNWKREHLRDNKNCIVSIWDSEKGQWISKEDTGTESQTEADKGLASDSFKRACVNWGIGRELYTAPFIWLANGKQCTVKTKSNGKQYIEEQLQVSEIAYSEDRKITALSIINARTGEELYSWTQKGTKSAKKSKTNTVSTSTETEEKVADIFLAEGLAEHYDIDLADYAAKLGMKFDKLTQSEAHTLFRFMLSKGIELECKRLNREPAAAYSYFQLDKNKASNDDLYDMLSDLQGMTPGGAS